MSTSTRNHPPLVDLIASDYLARGWSVIPVKSRGKTPLVEWRPYQYRLPTAGKVRAWLSRWPTANLGIVTGAVSRLVVVDLDGEGAVREFVRRMDDAMFCTPVVRTARGAHLYFQHPGRPVPTRVSVLPGLDIRGDGGFVVAPGSVHESGAMYRFLGDSRDVEPAPIPEWLLELLDGPPTTGPEPSEEEIILEGQRNENLYRLARSLKARRLSEPAILATVRAENAVRCRPPLSEAELSQLVANALTQADRPGFAERPTEQCEETAEPPAPDEEPIASMLRKEGILRVSEVEPKEVDWLWPGRIPRGMLTLLVGDPENGKSYVSLDMTARITNGRDWPDGAPATAIGDVLILQAEDDPAITVRPRLDRLGADVNRVLTPDPARADGGLSIVSDTKQLERILAAFGTIRLVVIDPLTAYLPASVDYRSDQEVRAALSPLTALAEKYNVAIVAVMHLNKDQQKQVMHRVGGSIAFVGVARCVVLVAKDRDNESRRLFLPHKLNIGPKRPGLAFQIEESGIRWERDPVTVTAQDALGGDEAKPKKTTKVDHAERFLRARLAGRSVAQTALEEEATGEGISRTALYDARKRLEIRSDEVTDSYGERVRVWSLPTDSQIPNGTRIGTIPIPNPSPAGTGGTEAQAPLDWATSTLSRAAGAVAS